MTTINGTQTIKIWKYKADVCVIPGDEKANHTHAHANTNNMN